MKTVQDRLNELGTRPRKRLSGKLGEIGAPYPPREMLWLAFKQERVLEVWVSLQSGRWQLLETYPILAASGRLGPKLCEGDRQVPEGIYRIESLNPNSRYHLSLRVNYPSEADRRWAAMEGRTDLGSDIMIHGKSVSAGCLAVGDAAVEELFVLAADAGIENIRLLISPVDFRKTDLPRLETSGPPWVQELYSQIRAEMGAYFP